MSRFHYHIIGQCRLFTFMFRDEVLSWNSWIGYTFYHWEKIDLLYIMIIVWAVSFQMSEWLNSLLSEVFLRQLVLDIFILQNFGWNSNVKVPRHCQMYFLIQVPSKIWGKVNLFFHLFISIEFKITLYYLKVKWSEQLSSNYNLI